MGRAASGKDTGEPPWAPDEPRFTLEGMRPSTLRMYGKERSEPTLTWAWVSGRLAAAPFYWLVTTRKDGTPHARPVHGVWADDRLLLSNGSWNHHHNWEANPNVAV